MSDRAIDADQRIELAKDRRRIDKMRQRMTERPYGQVKCQDNLAQDSRASRQSHPSTNRPWHGMSGLFIVVPERLPIIEYEIDEPEALE